VVGQRPICARYGVELCSVNETQQEQLCCATSTCDTFMLTLMLPA